MDLRKQYKERPIIRTKGGGLLPDKTDQAGRP